MTSRIETRWCCRALLLFALSLAVSGAQAQAEAAQRVLLLGPAEAELSARIRGQTRDLGVALEVSEVPAANDAESARRLGQARAAAIVVWSEPRGAAGIDLYVLDVERGELRTRRVSTPEKEALASSTTAEMAALVVRSELSALLSEIKAARAQKPEPAEGSAPSASTSEQVKPAPPPEPPARRAAEPSGPWLVALGYRPSRPFRSTFAHGLALALQRDLSGFALGLSAIGTLPLTLSRAGTQIRLARLQLRLHGLKRWQVTPPLALLLGVSAALSIDFRSTEKVEAPMIRTGDATTATGGFGLLAQLEWQFAGRVGALVSLGADAVPWRTRFVYENGGESGLVARLSWLDLWGMVGFFTRF